MGGQTDLTVLCDDAEDKGRGRKANIGDETERSGRRDGIGVALLSRNQIAKIKLAAGKIVLKRDRIMTSFLSEARAGSWWLVAGRFPVRCAVRDARCTVMRECGAGPSRAPCTCTCPPKEVNSNGR